MKRTGILLLTTIILVCLVSQSVLAQPAGRGQGRQEGGPQGDRPRMMGGDAGMFGGLNLTEKQQAKMNEIRTKYMDQIRNAETPEARRELFTKMREEVNGILTEEQRAQMQQRMGQGQRPAQPETPAPAMGDPMEMIRQMAERLNLTEEQQAKVAEMYRAAMQKLMTDIREQVLTEEQRARLGRRGMGMMPGGPGGPQDRGPSMRGRGMFGMEGLDLTEEQQKKMDDIRQKYMDQMQNADRDSRREVFTKMREEMDKVLTDEQKKKAEELRQQRGFGGFGGRGQGQEGQGPAGRQGGQGAPGSRRGGA
ncbi:MAG: Spy/CpxP family protein refolding chaperone, partial [Sedimentisphaerales bacterium]|nr:Spy/CpxP family protein refolding chaperone [Sedimentisphaerales bacterium]